MDILSILHSIVTYIYIPIAVIMILIILLQSGKGGLGTALGGGASQSVFGGGGASEFMAKVTQALAFGFMICCVFLAYAGAHSGSSRLKSKSDELNEVDPVVNAAGEINYERIGPNPLPLPEAGGAPAAAAEPPTSEDAAADAPGEGAEEAAPAEDAAPTGDAAPADGAPAEVPGEAAPSEEPAEAPAEAPPAGDAPTP